MAKITAAYPALNGGVSQRPERALRLNYLRAQLNMIFDPVVGLTRRPGMQAKDDLDLTATVTGAENPALLEAATLADASLFRTHTAFLGEDQLTVHYRTGARPVNSLFGFSGAASSVVVVNQTSNTVLPVPTRKSTDAVLDALFAGGVSAVTSVGDLVVLAGNTVTPSVVESFPWAEPDNQRRHVVWVRGGAYSRAFKLSMIRGNQRFTIEYTTRDASLPKLLDTSDLLPTDPDYSKKVSDRTNAYNSEATAWIAAALSDIAPENIASKLAAGVEQSGFLSPGSTVAVQGPNVVINDPTIEEVESDDGGDGNLMRAVGNVVGAPELLTVVGYPGKIVKVRPGNSERGDVFYLKARAKDGSMNEYTSVTWEEAAGEVSTPDTLFVYLTVSGGQPYISSDLAWINTQTGRSYPLPTASVSGDLISNPAPEFFGSKVTALGVFKDRLIVTKANGYVASSRTGDYLNFFRQSAVTVVETDPVSFTVIGAEGDTVRHTVSYDQNLVLVGESRQYALPDRAAFVPGSAGAAKFSAVAGMETVRPVVVGDALFYAKFNNGFGSVHTLRPGRIVESPQEHDVTEAVNNLIDSQPLEVVAMATPDLAFLRTAGGEVFAVDYFHVDGEQRYAVHTWDFPEAGNLIGISEYRGRLRALWQRGYELHLEELEFQTASRGVVDPQPNDAGRTFVSRAVLVSPRFSPEAGNITGAALGANGYASQHVTVASMRVFFSDTAGAKMIKTTRAGSEARTIYPKELP